MKKKLSLSMLEKMRDARIKKIAHLGNFIEGCFVMGRHRCANPQCSKCFSGEKHSAHRLSLYKGPRKTKTVYIPVDMAGEVRKWVIEYKRLKELVREISEINIRIIRMHVPEKKAQKKGSLKKKSRQ